MAENPLLPNAELQALHRLTRRCVALERSLRRKLTGSARAAGHPRLPPASREALLAATVLQLQPGDLLIAEPGDQTAQTLRTERGAAAGSDIVLPDLRRDTPRLLLAAAMAAALQRSGTERLVLAFIRERSPEPQWQAALHWAQEQRLPLVLVCADPRGQGAFRSAARAPRAAFSWGSVARSAGRCKLPILTLDGEDAVAVYRSMQESALRARSGSGPALLWAMLPPEGALAGRSPVKSPLGRLQRYLRSRKIPF